MSEPARRAEYARSPIARRDDRIPRRWLRPGGRAGARIGDERRAVATRRRRLSPACRAGRRPVPWACGRFSRGWPGVVPGQAGVLQTVMTAWAMWVAVSRPAPVNAGRALALRTRRLSRPVMTRLLLIALIRAV